MEVQLRSAWDGGEFFDELNDWDEDSVSDVSEAEVVSLESRESLLRLLGNSKSAKKTVQAQEPADHLPGWVHEFESHPAPSQPLSDKIRRKQEMGLLGNVEQKQNATGGMSNHT